MARLGELFTIASGGTPDKKHAEYYENGSIPWVKTGDLKEKYVQDGIECITEQGVKNSSAKRFPPNTVLVAMYGATIGACSILPYEATTNQACAAFLPTPDVLPDYLYYFLCSKKEQFVKDGVGGAQPNISASYLKNVEMQVPSLQEQHIVIAILNKAQELISLRKHQIAKLDELVKARFVEMFGDVIHNTKQWPTYRFDQIATSRLGKMLDAKKQTGTSTFPYLANFNVQWFRFDLSKLNSMDFDNDDQVEFALQDGDLLVCEGGEIGRCAVWHNELDNCYFQKALHRVRCDQTIVLPDYLAWWFKYNCEYGGFSDIEGAKATIAHLPGAKLKALNVTVPDLQKQHQFAAFVAQIDQQKLTIQHSLAKMELLKKALMQKYFG